MYLVPFYCFTIIQKYSEDHNYLPEQREMRDTKSRISFQGSASPTQIRLTLAWREVVASTATKSPFYHNVFKTWTTNIENISLISFSACAIIFFISKLEN